MNKSGALRDNKEHFLSELFEEVPDNRELFAGACYKMV